MRRLAALLVLVPMVASAQPPAPPPDPVTPLELSASPTLAELQKKLKAGDKTALAAFWKSVHDKGTPLVEPLPNSLHSVLVTFLYRSEKVKNVGVFGLPLSDTRMSLLERLPGSDVWAASYRIRDDARFSYSMMADVPMTKTGLDDNAFGRFLRADWLNPHRLGPDRSFLVLPNAPAQPLTMAARDVPMGEVHVHKVKSKQLGNERRIYVYTPPGYKKDGGPYPLVVLFDGWSYFSNIPTATILDNLIAQKKLPPTIAVSIDPVDRLHELGVGEKFIDVVAREIVPWVQNRYRATTDPRATVVGGLSLGGLASAYAAFRHPEVFGNVLSQSGSFWWFQPGDQEYEWLTRQYASVPKKPIRFYLEVGFLEGGRPNGPTMVLANNHLRDVLIAKGYTVTYRPFVGGHDAICWRGTFGDALAGLLSGAHPGKARAAKPTDDITVTDVGGSLMVDVLRAAALDGSDAALRLFRESRDKTDRYDIDEAAVNVLGYLLMYGASAPKAAVGVLEDNVKHFPKSANTYDSLAEALFVAGDRAGAQKNYKKSLELDPKNWNADEMLKLLAQP